MNKHLVCYRALLFSVIFVFLVQNLWAIEWSTNKRLKIGINNQYDSNILKISSATDSNRVNGMAEEFKLVYSFWTKWNKKIKAFQSIRTGYEFLPNHTYANQWNISAKSKIYLKLNRKLKHSILPGTKLNFQIKVGYVDKFYTDRLLGEEYIINVNNTEVQFKDLFDKKYLQLGPEIDFTFSKKLAFQVSLIHEINNYKNINEPSINYFYSLDNTQNDLLFNLIVRPSKTLEINPYYSVNKKTYLDKLAKTAAGQSMTGQHREYKYKKLGLNTQFSFKKLTTKIGFLTVKRDDQFEGYYNYDYYSIFGKIIYNFNAQNHLIVYYDYAKKDYKILSLGGNILKNSYHFFKGEYQFEWNQNFQSGIGLLYDSENSSFFKYTYKRWVPYFSFSYIFDE